MTEHKVAALEDLLGKSGRICIVVHTHPDGDALGSGLALEEYLRERRGKDVTFIVPDPAPSSMAFLCRGRRILTASDSRAEAEAAVAGCDLLFLLDANDFQRTEGLSGPMASSKARKVLIDHHLNPDEESFDLVFSKQEISSTCELLFRLLRSLEKGNIAGIPAGSLYALMTGMTTDTNNFANSVYPSTLEMASELLQAGVDRDDILLHLYHEVGENRVAAWSDILHNGLTILPNGIAFMVMRQDFMDRYGLGEGDTEGLVNIPLSIDRVKISVFAREEGGLFRISIRSKKGWSANGMARQHFHGGGHELAAGGKVFIPDDIPSAGFMEEHLRGIAARFLQTKAQNQS